MRKKTKPKLTITIKETITETEDTPEDAGAREAADAAEVITHTITASKRTM